MPAQMCTFCIAQIKIEIDNQNLRLTKMAVLQPFLANFPPSKTKLRFRRSFWGAEWVYTWIGSKVMTQMKKHTKMQRIQKKLHKWGLFYTAPQNDCQNLNFVKDIYVGGRKLARNGRKTAICPTQILVISL